MAPFAGQLSPAARHDLRLADHRDGLEGEAGERLADRQAGVAGGKLGELARAAHQQLVLDRLLQMPVRALDRAVLMREAGIVARRRHAVMGAKILVAPRKVIACGAIEIAERGRQAVAAVLFGHAAQRPQGVPQALGERQEALAAEHHMGMLEA